MSSNAFEKFFGSLASPNHPKAIVQIVWLAGGGENGGKETVEALLRGELKIVFQYAVIKLVDTNGRGIPLTGMKGTVDADRSFYLTQPKVDFVERLARLQEFYGKGLKFMSATEFEDRCLKAIERIKGDPQVGNLLKGPYFPWVAPQLLGDIGQMLDETLVPAMERSHKSQFPQRKFKNYRHGELAQQVTAIPGTRQDRMVEALAKGSACGVYFPALQGFGITAAREFVGHTPNSLILSGLEVPVVATAYPEIVGRDWKTPALDMSSLQWQSAAYSLCCHVFNPAFGDEFYFGNRNLGANDRCAGGLSVLG